MQERREWIKEQYDKEMKGIIKPSDWRKELSEEEKKLVGNWDLLIYPLDQLPRM